MKLKVGLIGCGNISEIYLKNLTTIFSDKIEILACTSIPIETAQTAAERFGIPRVYGNYAEMLEDSSVECILNLTPANIHYQINMQALKAGKHVYSEKTFALNTVQAKELIEEAEKQDVYICSAPDTFMGAGQKTCRKLIDDGEIGTVIGGTTTFLALGPERWHPAPEAFYQEGAGPLMDMGPYYITAMVSFIGRVKRVFGCNKKTYGQRTITAEERNGEVFDVKVPTDITGILEFENGAAVSVRFSFDIAHDQSVRTEIYGTQGTMIVPDANYFDGEIRLKKGSGQSEVIPLCMPYSENSRGLGLYTMADAIRNGTKAPVSSELSYHVLEVLEALLKGNGSFIDIQSDCERPQLL